VVMPRVYCVAKVVNYTWAKHQGLLLVPPQQNDTPKRGLLARFAVNFTTNLFFCCVLLSCLFNFFFMFHVVLPSYHILLGGRVKERLAQLVVKHKYVRIRIVRNRKR
jgi:hypothetical protein